MSDLIKQVGGLDKAKKILENAPDWAVSVNLHNGMYYELSEYKKGDTFLSALRQAIADHDRTDTCVDIKNHLSPSTEVIER